MGVNKVDLANGETLIDLQNDTVTPKTLAKGKTAHNAQGEQIIGEMEQTVAKEEIEINVPTITQNGHYELTAPEGKVISKATVEVAVPTQGGSGIIEVPELPTENIDENAVYRVVINTEPTVYVYMNGAYDTLENVLKNEGMTEVYFHFVDELPSDMIASDVSAGVVHCYYPSSGRGYLYITGTGTITMSLATGILDKGITEDISKETENGTYMQLGSSIERWYIRVNGEWKMISPDTQEKNITLTKAGRTVIVPDEGKVLVSVGVNIGFLTIGDLVDNKPGAEIDITEDFFVKSDGSKATYIREYAFAKTQINSGVIPDHITTIQESAFYDSTVKKVTFKGTPRNIANSVFFNCFKLTTINVPWAEGAVAGIPFGAPNATINYNYTGE